VIVEPGDCMPKCLSPLNYSFLLNLREMSLKNRWNCILDFFHRRIILLFLVLLTVFIYFSSGAYSPQPGNLSYHLVECLVEEYVRWSESRTATLGGVESERRGSLAAGKTAPAQSAFRDLDSRKVRTPGGLHAGTPKLRLEKLSSLIVWFFYRERKEYE